MFFLKIRLKLSLEFVINIRVVTTAVLNRWIWFPNWLNMVIIVGFSITVSFLMLFFMLFLMMFFMM